MVCIGIYLDIILTIGVNVWKVFSIFCVRDWFGRFISFVASMIKVWFESLEPPLVLHFKSIFVYWINLLDYIDFGVF